MRLVLLLSFLLLPVLLIAQPVRVDIGSYTGSSVPGMYTPFKGKLYFIAYDSTNSNALWSTDTAGNVTRIASLNYGYNNGGSVTIDNKLKMAVLRDTLFFCAANDSAGAELFGYDGVTGPFLVADINTGVQSSYPSGMMVLNGILYFSAATVANGNELWAYKPLKHAASLVWDLEPGAPSGNPHDMVGIGDELCFIAETEASGNELNIYNPIGRTLNCLDIVPGKEGSSPMNIAVHNKKMYFTAKDPVYGHEMFTFNGQSLPKRVTDIAANNADAFDQVAPCGIGMMGKQLYFSAGDGVNPRQLYRYDTLAKTLSVDMLSTADADVQGFAEYHNKMYFFAKDNAGDSWLYSSNGSASPAKVAQLQAALRDGKVEMMAYGDWLYLTVTEPNGQPAVYKYNDAITTGISIATLNAAVKLYPNPVANTDVTLEVQKNMQVVITDIMGKPLYQSTTLADKHILPTANLSTGIYFVNLYNDGRLQYSGRLQKQ